MVDFNYIDYSKHADLGSVGGFDTHHIYLTCEELSNKLLPIDANPREPSHSRIVDSMQDTLADNPSDFIKWNNGLTVVCESVSHDAPNSQVTINFSDSDEGICNGGHTYFAIETADGVLDSAGVHLEVIEVPTSLGEEERQDEIVEIAKKRNNINNLDDYTVADFLDCYQIFKDVMDDEHMVSWHENDSKAYSYAIDAPELVRLLATLDPNRFHHDLLKPSSTYHKTAAISKGKIHSRWFDGALEARKNDDEPPMSDSALLINDMLEIRDMLSYSLKHDTFSPGIKRASFFQDNVKGANESTRNLHVGKYDGETGWKLPSALEVMLIGMFRSNIYLNFDESGEMRYIGWVLDHKELWDDRKEDVLTRLKRYYDDVGKSYRDFKNSESPYELNLYKYGHDPDWPHPPAQILYDTSNHDSFEAIQDREDARYWLESDGDGLVELSVRSPSDPVPYYSKI